MASESRAPCGLPDDYLQRWYDLAEWSIKHQHGPAARYSLMFALTLRRSVLADRAHIATRLGSQGQALHVATRCAI